MARYIDADALRKKDLIHIFVDPYDVNIFEFILDEAPTADVAEVKHGEWKLCDDAFGNDVEYHRCSVCKSEAIFECIYQPIYDENYDGEMEYIAEEFAGINEFLTDYCPHCGAKMDGGKHDN